MTAAESRYQQLRSHLHYLRVEDAATHELLGEVVDIIETGANDVYLVRGQRGEILVPAIKDVVKRIDPAAGHMLIQPLPGMLPG